MNRGLMSRAMIGAALLTSATAGLAQERSAIKPGFSLRPGTSRIVLMRPNIRVGAQSTGGMNEPNADWTRDARANIETALHAAQTRLGNDVVSYDEGGSGEGALATEYSQLFGAVADSAIEYQFFAGNRLPTKKRKDSFEWGLGTDLGKLRSLTGADYALFINTDDQYGSTGRKILQIMAVMSGNYVTSGLHAGHAGLVDLKTGELVWLNADRAMGGDVRRPDGAAKRVAELLAGFPGKPAEAGPGGQ